MRKRWGNLFYVPFSLLALVAAGTFGYILIERMAPIDALFLTVITLSTVGFGTLQPLSEAGKLFTIGLIIVGVAVFSYHLTRLFSVLIEKGFLETLERRRMDRKIGDMESHYIVCGCGRIGSVVMSELKEDGVPMVVLEKDPAVLESIASDELPTLQADAREEASLRRAGVERAKGLVALLPTDADNLYLILTAKDLNPRLTVLARANDPGAERRLLKAGATHVISPHREGGKRIARMILNPHLTDFIEMATGKENIQLQLEEVVIRPNSPLAGKTIGETGLLRDHRILVVAIRGAGNAMTFSPEGNTRINTGDALIVLGPNVKANPF